MGTIPLADADGREPLPICRRHREWLSAYYKSEEAIVLRFFTDDAPVRQRDKAEETASVKHLRECPRCRPWVPTIVPPEMYRRQSRQAQYCCAGMFCAVEEYQSHPPRFSFTMFRGEDPCWQIDGQNAFAHYCPWCGRKLPKAPFIKDA
jgi:hypothetical protein